MMSIYFTWFPFCGLGDTNFNNIVTVFQGCSECFCKLDFFLGGLFLSLKNNEGGYPVGGGRCLTFCKKNVILDPKNRHQMVTLYYYVSLLGKLFSNFPDSLSPKFLSSPVRVNR